MVNIKSEQKEIMIKTPRKYKILEEKKYQKIL